MGDHDGLEGRTKLLSDEKFRALNKALAVDKKKPQGRGRNIALEREEDTQSDPDIYVIFNELFLYGLCTHRDIN